MKIAIHVTERIKHKWPSDYWGELVRKLTAKGHDVYMFTDDSNVRMDDDNPKFHDRCRVENPADELKTCDLFIGPPLSFYREAVRLGMKTVVMNGPVVTPGGVTASIPCVGCEESDEPTVDCRWNDELCQLNLTPNDVLFAAGV